jgi:pimeloyl-ACP methyl ester carboxylesterase
VTEPRRDEIDLGRQTVGTLTWGPADGPVVLALHGFPDSAWTWRKVAPLLAADGRRVVAPFSRGYAPSSFADGCYQVGALVRDVEQIAAHLGAREPVSLLGHDWGAITAYAAGSHRPDLFDAIVTIAVPPLSAATDSVRPWRSWSALCTAVQQARCSWYIGYQQLPWLPERTFDRVVARLWADWSPGYDANDDLQHLREALPSVGHRTAALRYYRALLQPWHRRDEYAAEQQHIGGVPSMPVLYLHGDRDGCLLPSLAREAASALGPGSRVELVADAGHFVQLEQPVATAELVRTHLDRQER